MNTTTRSLVRIMLVSFITIGALVYLTQCTEPVRSETILLAGN